MPSPSVGGSWQRFRQLGEGGRLGGFPHLVPRQQVVLGNRRQAAGTIAPTGTVIVITSDFSRTWHSILRTEYAWTEYAWTEYAWTEYVRTEYV